MPSARTPPSRWVAEGLRALAAGGPDAVRVEVLAEAIGVSKGGFYWHFDDRAALLDEMLATWERVVIDEVITAVENQGGDARAKLSRLFSIASEYSGHGLPAMELAIRDWARRDQAVARRLRRVDNRRMDYMRSLFAAFCDDDEEVEVRCLLVMSLFVGHHLVAVDHGARSRVEVLELTLKRLLA